MFIMHRAGSAAIWFVRVHTVRDASIITFWLGTVLAVRRFLSPFLLLSTLMTHQLALGVCRQPDRAISVMEICRAQARALSTTAILILFLSTVARGQTSNLPTPWIGGDIGSPQQAGSATFTQGVFTVNGSGADIWGPVQQFQ